MSKSNVELMRLRELDYAVRQYLKELVDGDTGEAKIWFQDIVGLTIGESAWEGQR